MIYLLNIYVHNTIQCVKNMNNITSVIDTDTSKTDYGLCYSTDIKFLIQVYYTIKDDVNIEVQYERIIAPSLKVEAIHVYTVL